MAQTIGSTRKAATGFSLVELIIVIAIIALLVATLLPAINASREAARRIACANNLRQIGIALQSYHTANGVFPVGAVEWRPPGNATNRQLAWSAFLLPFLDQNDLYELLDLSAPFDSDKNAQGAAQVLPVYLCPSSPHGSSLIDGRAPCHYGGIYGERITSPNDPPKGIMLLDQSVRAEDVKDGLSSTVIVAEDTMWTDGQWINGRNIFDQAFGVNDAPAFENDIRSQHPGGAQVVMADATVRFLDEQMDLHPLAALCTRAMGDEDHWAD